MTTDSLPVRAGDPDTSAEAARNAASHAATVRPIVLDIIRDHGPMTHQDVINQYHHRQIIEPDMPRASESGIRTRVSELVDQGLVIQDFEDGQSLFGNRSKRWVDASLVKNFFASDEETELILFEVLAADRDQP